MRPGQTSFATSITDAMTEQSYPINQSSEIDGTPFNNAASSHLIDEKLLERGDEDYFLTKHGATRSYTFETPGDEIPSEAREDFKEGLKLPLNERVAMHCLAVETTLNRFRS